jgi:hypothetical protein
VEGVDWYNCDSAHSQPLNANRKAYAAWWLWCRLAGWNPASGVDDSPTAAPSRVVLLQNHPNPFNPTTNIRFSLEDRCQVALNVYTLRGRLVANLVRRECVPGSYDVRFSGAGLASGTYCYRLQAGNATMVKKFVLLE